VIVVDTNVISELLRPKPHPFVKRWADTTHPSQLYTTSISHGELLSGIALMPEGRRRNELAETLARLFHAAFASRILPYDSSAALHYARIIAQRTALGRPIAQADAQIAAICLTHKATIATRDARGFERLGLDVVNPWAD